jgi:hypothetical protein
MRKVTPICKMILQINFTQNFFRGFSVSHHEGALLLFEGLGYKSWPMRAPLSL